jgi:Transcriptional regulator
MGLMMDREEEFGADSADSGGVQAVEVGMEVLRVLVSAGRPVPLKMVTAATGMQRAKVHRYLVSLVRCGLALQEESTGYYGLGTFAVQLGLSALGTLDRDALGRQAIRELRDTLNISACLSVWAEGPTVIAVEPAEATLFIGFRSGSRLSLTGSATGRVFMAYLPAKTWRNYLPRDESSKSIDLEALRRQVLKNRMAGVTDLVMTGMSGFAAPVLDHTGAICAALTLAGPTGTFDLSINGATARALLKRADELSARLGNLMAKSSLRP